MYASWTLSRGMALFHCYNKDRGECAIALNDKDESGADGQGPRALYKGASVPAISWGITDSILMGR